MRTVCAALLSLLVAACGSAATAKPSADRAQAAAVVLRYTHAVARKDWSTVCATRTAAERKLFAGKGGTCANAFNIMLGNKRLGALERARVRFVTIRGGVAGVHLNAPFGKLAAVRDQGAWRVKDIPDKRIP